MQALASACCKAAQVLHAAGCVHCNFCMANIVQLEPGAYMVIELETVGKADAGPLPAGFAIVNGWNCDTLSKSREYTPHQTCTINRLDDT